MFTLFYIGATFLQSWRIKNACNKMAQQLAQQASVSFYTLPTGAEDGYDTALATSELCMNRNAAKVTEILWLHDQQRGCSMCPMQILHIMPWISFPEAAENLLLLPFAYTQTPLELVERLSGGSKTDLLHLLLEMEVEPCYKNGRNENIVKIEDYGKLKAWKIDSHLAVLIETDVEHFTKLLISTFLQNNLLINDQLPLLRIESITYNGKPQPYELVSSHLRKSTRTAAKLSYDEWQKHLGDLRALSVLAHQATEFEYNKNRTEGKTGIVKPDLIPFEKKKLLDEQGKNGTGEIVVTASQSKATNNTKSPIRKQTTAPTISSSSPSTIIEQTTKLIKTEVATHSSAAAASPSPSYSSITPAKPSGVGSSKIKAKPTEIKKPGVTIADSRFKTTKVSESPVKSTLQSIPPTPTSTETTAKVTPTQTKISPAKSSSTSTKSSELEKIAAAAITQKHKSPLHASTTTSSTTAKAAPPLTSNDNTTTNSNAASSSKVATAPKDSANSMNNKNKGDVGGGSGATKRPNLIRHKDSLRESKPLNILVYSDSASARESAVITLKDILEKDMYTIYPMTPQQALEKYWLENTALLVVCGAVSMNIGEILVDYFLRGGKVLSLCSDILHFILPNYRTAEVREHELVQFSYDKWQKVKMMHHIFCYQPSPIKKNFSTDSDDSAQASAKRSALVCPRSIELKDLHGELHNLDVKVLGTEETWNTPSLLLASNVKSGGRAVFSQVHLETNPIQFETDESKFSILKQNEKIRLEIFSDLLSKHLNVNVKQLDLNVDATRKCIYQNAYFLGHHESKFELIEKLKEKSAGTNNIIATSKLTLQFCGKDDKPSNANTNILPILIHSCPDDFSTVQYFDNLKTNYIGRLVIYAPVVSSSMNVINELELTNGIAVLPRQQTEGIGRSNNQWLSPLGCAMFSIQLHISLDTPLGSRLPLLQHIIGAAIVNTLKRHDIYKNLEINLKWPNDIYANVNTKIGGLIVKTTIICKNAIVNIGCGINLNNSKPTICINDLIDEYNRNSKTNIPHLLYEHFIAMIFNEIERLVEQIQTGDFKQFYKLYYELWLHNEQTIQICDKDGKKHDAKVIGIDDYGYLQVKTPSGVIETVQPDGNSFDMLKGLIVPKFN